MNDLSLGIVFLVLALAGVVVRKTYYYLPYKELKRRAEKHDKQSVKLFRAVAYGTSLRTLIWLYIGFTSAASFILLARVLPVWLSLLIIAPLLWIVFSLVPMSSVSRPGLWLTSLVTPIVVRILSLLQPVLSHSEKVDRRYAVKHTGIFEKHDLMELIELQKSQHDNRLSQQQLEILKHSLDFEDKKVRDIFLSRKKIKTVLSSDTVGPVLINELHENAQEYVLVKDQNKGPIVGTLAYKSLGITSKGQVKDCMNDTIYYLHEDDPLSEVLQAYFTTSNSMFVVVNSFGEFIGIVTVEMVIKELLGKIENKDFEAYGDIEKVSARHNKETDITQEEKVKPNKSDAEMLE